MVSGRTIASMRFTKFRGILHILVSTPYQDSSLVGDILTTDQHPAELLVLHGAGEGRRARFEPLRSELLSRGIGSVAVDFIGHGDTGGMLEGSTLRNRTDQAREFINSLENCNIQHVFGSSMGAFTAVQLIALYKIQTLILNVPAMYDVAAYDVPFGKQFSEVIRVPGSWEKSNGWELLSSFQGNLLVISGELDEVIPAELIDRILKSANAAATIDHIQVEGCDHFVSKRMIENQEIRLMVADRIKKAIDRSRITNKLT